MMDEDMLDKLASGEYSISPRSGRLRKRVRVKKEKSFFKRSKVRRNIQTTVWVILVVAVVISLFFVLPELNIVSDKKKPSSDQR